MKRTLFFLLLVCIAADAQTAAKRPFTFEDMMKLKRVNEPVPSPDGKWVLFSAVDVDLAANTKTPHVWIVPLAGVSHVYAGLGNMGEERKLMAEQDADRPRWAPDGKRFLIRSTKEHGYKLWIHELDARA